MLNMTIPPNCVVFDTETTGFSHAEGDKLVEIGAVRMRDGLPTDETFHVYINPERTVPDDAVRVHGLTTKFLADKPIFPEVAMDFINFVGDLPFVAHNAKFASSMRSSLKSICRPTPKIASSTRSPSPGRSFPAHRRASMHSAAVSRSVSRTARNTAP
jgi:DNA polymerase III epsilon subunit